MSATQTNSEKTTNTEVYNRTIALKGQAPIKFALDSQQNEKLKLLNKMAASAANTAAATSVSSANSVMCNKISLDLHDSTIQPYIGLKLGLEALRRKIPEGAALAAEVDELVMMAVESIAELRLYVAGLKSQINSQLKPQLGIPLVEAIVELAKKYQLRHGIKVLINVETHLKLSEHLSTEIYQLVCEGLSNIHRHTQSKKAEINLYDQKGQLVIEIINQDNSVQNFIYFTPRSMVERVSYLGGTIFVNHEAGDKTRASKTIESKTIVTAKIPLQLIERPYASFA